MHRLTITTYVILFYSITFAQGDINYCHKSLIKELNKFNNDESNNMNEIIIPDSVLNSYPMNGKFFLVSENSTPNTVKYVYTGRINSCRAGGCSIIRDISLEEDQEYFDYFILFDSVGTIKLVRVFNYQATHGQEVSSKGWLKQFIDYSGSRDLQVGKEIDAISGATISVYGITHDVQLRTEILKEYINRSYISFK